MAYFIFYLFIICMKGPGLPRFGKRMLTFLL